MIIDLTKMNTGLVTSIDFDEEVVFDKTDITKVGLVDLNKLIVKGSITKNSSGMLTLKAFVTGTMILSDSISLEEIDYPFSFDLEQEIDENEEKLENTLDITEDLWQNIVLEVPLKLTQVDDFNEYQGDGWKLVSEDSIDNTNSPFNELKDLMGEE